MNTIKRLIPYVWPHRWKLLWSVFFAIVVAILWGANLSTAYPMVKVLLQGESLQEYIEKRIDETEKTIAAREQQLAENPGDARVQETHGDDLIADQDKLAGLVWTKEAIIDHLPSDPFTMLSLVLIAFFAGTVIKGICVFVQEYLTNSVVVGTTRDLRNDCFRRTLNLDYQTISGLGTGELMSRYTNDTSQLGGGLALVTGRLVREPLKAGVCIGFAFWINWRLTLLSFVFLPVMGVLFYKLGRALKNASRRQLESMSRLYKTMEETLDSSKVVLGFHGMDRAVKRFESENREFYKKAMRIAKLDAATSPTSETLGIAAAFLALFPGAYMVLNNTKTLWGIDLAAEPMDVASLGLMYVLLIGTLDPLRKLSSFYSRFKLATAAGDRIFELMDRQSLVNEVDHPQPLPRHRKKLAFENITFTYRTFEETLTPRPPALTDVSLDVECGEVIAIVGENGSGKSTLVNLLPRFFDADAGMVSIDGSDITQAKLLDLRSQLGLVTQETLLFDDTIRNNILYCNENATAEEVENAAKKAHVTDFVESLPEGFETRVGEKGGRLSGGQRQRIALARAILRDPAILILDEATSAIDAQSEALIHESLKEFVKGRTTLMVTHKVTSAALEYIDRIVVMEQGKIAAVGPHEALLEQSPIYRRLFEHQGHRTAA